MTGFYSNSMNVVCRVSANKIWINGAFQQETQNMTNNGITFIPPTL